MGYTEELRDVELVLGEDEINKRIAGLAEYQGRTELFRYTSPPDGPGMTPAQFVAWATLAAAFDGVTMDGSAIYRPKTGAELRKDVLVAEYNKRSDYGRKTPAVCYEDLIDAGHGDRAAQILEEHGDRARRDSEPAYTS